MDRVDTAAFAAKALADRLYEGLVRGGWRCTRVRIEAESEHGESLSRIWRHDGAFSAAALAERVRWQLDGWLTSPTRPTAGLTRLRLVPDEVVADQGTQQGFWGGVAEADQQAWARVLARVQSLLGPEGVLTAVLEGGRSPVDRARLIPWGDERSPSAGSGPALARSRPTSGAGPLHGASRRGRRSGREVRPGPSSGGDERVAGPLDAGRG